jgi:hypothetical protein
MRLAGPTGEIAPVVGDVEAQTNQPAAGYSGDGLIDGCGVGQD